MNLNKLNVILQSVNTGVRGKIASTVRAVCKPIEELF